MNNIVGLNPDFKVILMNVAMLVLIALVFLPVPYWLSNSNPNKLAASIATTLFIIIALFVGYQLLSNKAVAKEGKLLMKSGVYSHEWVISSLRREAGVSLEDFSRSNGIHIIHYSSGYYHKGKNKYFILRVSKRPLICFNSEGNIGLCIDESIFEKIKGELQDKI
ncbi:hypothetical protein GPY51_01025 [Photorhabdus laumondii subsp. laumondii]|uniref:Photorhabdus luminescens subsp. laumondii TTO1 complete genome segment 10/17 n=3 Tax=Photorhabdus laumondii TaxID=2218628 RepID=Q7N3I4_PHOLL|nr:MULTISPECIES: hypothetical protein [Photorhabdus]PQQ39522.1 hypothetical protein C6H68_00790 [Photorhabdus luminescens]AWK42458.1 hypothetical protein A4R40_13610 [Photorhabdus laumondii subsp. laumondii]AXG43307.1 hypothetical protein PluDJC_14330 [Photorhabdus laumondii subsp. laumondii]AXG47779.1 hypothetical protein PluTT01m_14020 [Photorhabdus laumondii subsp. laumondii]KTL63535.1 hypothetical protein AA106_00300 [Photorhabdus laumondii subsp. laumondii]